MFVLSSDPASLNGGSGRSWKAWMSLNVWLCELIFRLFARLLWMGEMLRKREFRDVVLTFDNSEALRRRPEIGNYKVKI